MRTNCGFKVLLVSLATGNLLAGGDPGSHAEIAERLTVGVCNYAKIPDRVLRPAMAAAEAIFRQAGVESDWISREDEPNRPVQLNLRMLSRGSRNPDSRDAFGNALVTGTSTPSDLADVFYGQVAGRAFTEPLISILLANVMAHEVGHLLLGARHSRDGIMNGQWAGWQLKIALAAPLHFSTEEARRLRTEAVKRLR